MTLRTNASLRSDLTTGGSAGDKVEHRLLLDFLDSFPNSGGPAATDPFQLNNMTLMFKLIGANMNVTTDQAFTKLGTFNSYLLSNIRAMNASTSLTTAAGGLYTGAAKTGVTLVAAGQVYSALVDGTVGVGLTLTAAANAVRTENPILSLTTGQGGAATADFYFFGWPLS